MEKPSTSMIIGPAIIIISAIIAAFILTRPGVNVDSWIIFSIVIIYPLIAIYLLLQSEKKKP